MVNKLKPVVSTVCHLKSLDKALVLGESLYKNNKLDFNIYYDTFTKALRLPLRVTGPSRFMALNRMITQSSNLISYKDLWK